MTIRLDPDNKKYLLGSIKRFFAEELDQDIGDLKAELVLGFCLREVGPTVYNGAITDAQAYFQGKLDDLDGSCFEPEFGYWTGSRRRGDSEA